MADKHSGTCLEKCPFTSAPLSRSCSQLAHTRCPGRHGQVCTELSALPHRTLSAAWGSPIYFLVEFPVINLSPRPLPHPSLAARHVIPVLTSPGVSCPELCSPRSGPSLPCQPASGPDPCSSPTLEGAGPGREQTWSGARERGNTTQRKKETKIRPQKSSRRRGGKRKGKKCFGHGNMKGRWGIKKTERGGLVQQ